MLRAKAGQLSQNLKAVGLVEEKRWPAGTAPPPPSGLPLHHAPSSPQRKGPPQVEGC